MEGDDKEINDIKLVFITIRFSELLYLKDNCLISMNNYRIRYKILLDQYKEILSRGQK